MFFSSWFFGVGDLCLFDTDIQEQEQGFLNVAFVIIDYMSGHQIATFVS